MADESKTDKPKKQPYRTAATIVKDTPNRYAPDWEAITPIKRRLVGASAAKQKRGKTRFAFTMPPPLAYLQLDASGEYMLKEARERAKKPTDIKHLKYFADPRGDMKSANAALWEKLLRDYAYSVANFRSVIVDTLTEALTVRKLAEHGRTTQIPKLWYGALYADFHWMVNEARQNDANVWFIHRVKDEYMNDSRTGNDILDGWRDIKYEAQVYVEHDRSDDGTEFITTIKECEQNAMVTGMVLDGDDNDFPALASRVFVGTDREDWE